MNIYYFNITVLRNRNVFGEVVKTLDDARAEKINRLRVTADKLRSAGAGILINFIKDFLPSECAYINEIEDEKINQQRFCEIWTIKEAYLKNIGIGLRKPLNSFEIDFSEDAPQIVGKKEYKFVQLKFDEKYIVTVCADQSDEIFDVEEVLVV